MSPKHRDRLPHSESLTWELDEIERLLKRREEIVRGYRMALDLGLDPRSGSEGGVEVGGSFALRDDGSATGYIPEAVIGDIDSDRPPPSGVYRVITAEMFKQVQYARKLLNNVLVTVDSSRLGAGVRQVKPDDKGVPNPELLRASAEAKCKRDGHVWDDKARECRVCGEPRPKGDEEMTG